MERRRQDSRDLDAARGVVRSVLLGVAVFLVAGAAWATPVGVCTDPAAEGWAWSACDSEHSVAVEASEVAASDLVLACDDLGSAGGSGCGGFGPGWIKASDVPADGYVIFSGVSGGEGVYRLLADIEGWPYAGGDGGGGGDDEDLDGAIADFDLSVAAGAFGAAFVLVGMFWALGKAVGLVVNSIRRF